ncbi:hypothetical protein GGS21DRAFT_487069 [Xylaria nigripes]|nr:hypothetical protein GGS21DRAFT_487069 [Xylaria nigripes]
MGCVCRAKSLRIFVQSLTDLRVASPVTSRSAQLNHFRLLATFSRAQARQPTRLFSSASAVYSPRQRSRVIADKAAEDRAVEEVRNASVNTVANEPGHKTTATPALLASDKDIEKAKHEGAIFDFSPESIDSLVMNLDGMSIAGKNPASDKHDNVDPNTKSERQGREKPPVGSSQLKRRKLLKGDAKSRSKSDKEKITPREPWKIQKWALKDKFPEGWRPRKRLSPDAIEGIRALHWQFPEMYPLPVLSQQFKVSPDAIRRILKSKWKPKASEEEDRQGRWFKRGINIWSQMAELGMKPPRRWRKEGVVRKPYWNKKRGPRTEYPYVPSREPPVPPQPTESAQRKLSGTLL